MLMNQQHYPLSSELKVHN